MNTMTANLPKPTEAPAVKTYNARDLIEDSSQVCLMLDGQYYVLRITRAGKLILTK